VGKRVDDSDIAKSAGAHNASSNCPSQKRPSGLVDCHAPGLAESPVQAGRLGPSPLPSINADPDGTKMTRLPLISPRTDCEPCVKPGAPW
jgi:hypothetical protein